MSKSTEKVKGDNKDFIKKAAAADKKPAKKTKAKKQTNKKPSKKINKSTVVWKPFEMLLKEKTSKDDSKAEV